jgi:hypothetical protein
MTILLSNAVGKYRSLQRLEWGVRGTKSRMRIFLLAERIQYKRRWRQRGWATLCTHKMTWDGTGALRPFGSVVSYVPRSCRRD